MSCSAFSSSVCRSQTPGPGPYGQSSVSLQRAGPCWPAGRPPTTARPRGVRRTVHRRAATRPPAAQAVRQGLGAECGVACGYGRPRLRSTATAVGPRHRRGRLRHSPLRRVSAADGCSRQCCHRKHAYTQTQRDESKRAISLFQSLARASISRNAHARELIRARALTQTHI